MRTRTREARRGASLIELVLLIGSVTLVLGICATFMHMLLRLERTGRTAIVDANNLGRLARHYREDVRSSSSVELGPEAAAVVLTLDDGLTVEYRNDRDGISRTERDGDRMVRGESYRLGSLGPARFVEGPGLLTLLLPRQGDPPRVGYVVEARPGKHLKLPGGEP